MNKSHKILLFAISITLFLSFTYFEKNKIIEGQSVGEIEIGMSVSEVLKMIKSKPEKITWSKHSFEYRFKKKGISIYEKQEDSLHKVFAITVYPKKWKGITAKGLKVNRRLRVKDVLEKYGKTEWGYTTDCSELDADYDKYGVYFSVKTLDGICDETEVNHDSLFFNSKITEITIGKVDTDY